MSLALLNTTKPLTDQQRIERAIGDSYTIVRLLGSGGMGSVYLARDRTLQRLVAIKVLLPDRGVDQEMRDQFRKEALTNARLAHPNIVPIHVFGERDDVMYIVMAYIPGESLGERLRRERVILVAETCRILADLAAALDYAHRQRVVHRDIKPENILLDRSTGCAMLTDFGVARHLSLDAMRLDHQSREYGFVRGTPTYMSPEQASGNLELDGRSDLYSLGVLGYTMLTGNVPFTGPSFIELVAQHLSKDPEPIAMRAPGTPAWMVAAITRCLAKNPCDRWSDGQSLLLALRAEGVRPDSLRAPLARLGRFMTQRRLRPSGSRQ